MVSLAQSGMFTKKFGEQTLERGLYTLFQCPFVMPYSFNHW